MVTLTFLCLIVGGKGGGGGGVKLQIFGKKPSRLQIIFLLLHFIHLPLPPDNYSQKSSRFWPLRGLSLGGSVKKENYNKSLFQIILSEVLKSRKKDIC